MLRKVVHIITGWAKKYKIIETTPAEQKLSELRLKICAECPFSKVSKALQIINGEGVYVEGIYCTKCKCPCTQKSLVIGENCPEEKW